MTESKQVPMRDKNGLTEEEFLASYRADRYERPSVTVDIVLFAGNRVLLIRRGGHPFLGKLAFPGGFVEPNETVQQAAFRELREETQAQGVILKQLQVFSEPDRDPRTRIITIPFLAFPSGSPEELIASVSAGDDAADASFWDFSVQDEGEKLAVTLQKGKERERFIVRRLPAENILPDVQYHAEVPSPLAGDHAAIFAAAWDELQRLQR
ncbi:MAG: NUDIX hydrolase [Oscillospiraceae bacterium]|nr:NUDIX hydrolase [Oscillospiraceae bacterium]